MGGCAQGPSKRVPQLIRHFFPRQFWIEPGPARQQHRQKMAKLQNIFIRSFPLCACVFPCAFFVLRVCPAARALHACVCVCFLSVCFCFPYICTPYNSTTYTERVWNHSLSSNPGHTMLVSMDWRAIQCYRVHGLTGHTMLVSMDWRATQCYCVHGLMGHTQTSVPHVCSSHSPWATWAPEQLTTIIVFLFFYLSCHTWKQA